jgi:NTP pyrophosphatase (non-canonical NTP hydrolase)
MTYCIYHIPGKKIGVTNDVKNRVEKVQGYSEEEYEILDMSDDIDYISKRELELQGFYGYRVDRQSYKDLMCSRLANTNTKTMRLNITEQTTTFPCPLNKLKGNIYDNLGLAWDTMHGNFHLDVRTCEWIVSNAKPSMYNDGRCYVYNKALSAFNAAPKEPVRLLNRFDLIREWANHRGLYEKGDTKTQYLKLIEEAGELGRAILKNDTPEVVDAIGDMVVVLTNLAHLEGHEIERCIDSAYSVINKRTGKMINGTFVKDE